MLLLQSVFLSLCPNENINQSLHPRGSPAKQYPSLEACGKLPQGPPEVLKYFFENRIFKVENLWHSKMGFSLWWLPNCLARVPLLQAEVRGSRRSESCSRLGFCWGRLGPALVSVMWMDWLHSLWCEPPTLTVSGVSTWAPSHCGDKETAKESVNQGSIVF